MGCTSSNKTNMCTELTSKEISFLKDNTRFSEREIRDWHAGFLNDCPNGKLNKKQLINVYQHFYPQGNVKPFCKYVFAAIDKNNDGEIDFVEYLMQIAALSHSNLDQRLAVAFDFYDISRDGQIDQKELATFISALYELVGEMNRKGDRHPKKRAAEIIDEFDLNRDKKLDKHEFFLGCRHGSVLQRILTFTV